MIKICTILGARPQFIKAAAFSHEVAQHAELEEVLIHTGQHFDAQMSQVFFDQLAIPQAKVHLNVHSKSHTQMVAEMMARLEPILVAESPTCVLVYGDTNSTLAGCLVAHQLNIPVIHVEAGLRSGNLLMAEEKNRILVDRMSQLLFCPTQRAVDQLVQREGIERGVFFSGDLMLDMMVRARTILTQTPPKLTSELSEHVQSPYALMTLHRAENCQDAERFNHCLKWIREHAGECPIIWPVHPRARRCIEEFQPPLDGIHLVEPLGYFELIYCLLQAKQLYTDSGGLQKEAFFARTPCVTLRPETEWPETVESGWNQLWMDVNSSLKTRSSISRDAVHGEHSGLFGDGHAASFMVREILAFFA